MSGTGKSPVIGLLAARGYKAVDADGDEFLLLVAVSGDAEVPGSPMEPDRNWVWHEDHIQALLSTADANMLFANRCAPNMGRNTPWGRSATAPAGRDAPGSTPGASFWGNAVTTTGHVREFFACGSYIMAPGYYGKTVLQPR